MQNNIVPYINKILENSPDIDTVKYIIACLANIASCIDFKKNIIESRCINRIIPEFPNDFKDEELTKYFFYFVQNICKDYPSAAYILGRLKVFKLISIFLSSKSSKELLGDSLDALYELIQIKENLYIHLIIRIIIREEIGRAHV